MTDDQQLHHPSAEGVPAREPLEPGTHLRLSVLTYIAVNTAYGLPIFLWPDLIWGTIGGADDAAVEVLSSVRWGGAILLAWAIGGLLVLARPQGRQTMITTFAIQYTMATVAILISMVAGEFDYADAWFPVASVIVVAVAGAYIWYGRWAGRHVLNA